MVTYEDLKVTTGNGRIEVERKSRNLVAELSINP